MNKTHASFFTGIRGFDKAAEAAGWENVLHCEINERLRLFSEKLNPKAASYGDITKSDFTIHRGRVFCLSAVFPCQPYSIAGQRKGTEDERYLWPHTLRAVCEIQPPWVVGENVRGIINWNAGLVFHQVQADLEAEGYEVLPFLLPAAGINAPHERYRTWFIAFNAKHYAANTCSTGCEEQHIPQQSTGKRFRDRGCDEYREYWKNFPTQPPVCDGDDGLRAGSLRAFIRDHSDGVLTEKEIDTIVSKAISAGNREIIKGGGNAIVPQLALRIFRAINAYDEI